MDIYSDLSSKVSPACYTAGRDGKPVLVLVCHNTAGPRDNNSPSLDRATAQDLSDEAARYLTNNDRQVSIHWLVGAEACGAPIYRIVPEESIAYHAGGTPPAYPSSWRNPDDGQVYTRYGVNQISIGIELYGQVGDRLGPNQAASLKALVQAIAGRFPIIAKPGHIVSHASLEGDRQDGKNWVDQARAWVAQPQQGGGSVPQQADLPYGAQVQPDGSILFPSTGKRINWGFKDLFLSVGGAIPLSASTSLADRIFAAVFNYGLPVEDEVKLSDLAGNQIGARQSFEFVNFNYQASQPSPWNIRPGRRV